MELGYALVSTTKQDLDRQVDALRQEGIAAKRFYMDKKSGANTNRPGLHAALDQAREGEKTVRSGKVPAEHHSRGGFPLPSGTT